LVMRQNARTISIYASLAKTQLMKITENNAKTGIDFEKWGDKCDPAKTEPHYLGRVLCLGGYDHTFKKHGRPPVWKMETIEELMLAVSQPYYPPAEEAKKRGCAEALCFDAPSKSPFKNGITDRDRARRKLQHRLKQQAAEMEREALVIKNKGFKPCRYKACKGRAHGAYGEKCPIASGRGKTGGKNGTGASKARKGAKNGRSKGGPKKRTQTAARLKAGEIKIKTNEIQTVDPFAYYQHKINKR